jgi:hypothetical protein
VITGATRRTVLRGRPVVEAKEIFSETVAVAGHPIFGAVAAYLAACLVLGGGTRAGFPSDVALQILAVPLLLWAG